MAGKPWTPLRRQAFLAARAAKQQQLFEQRPGIGKSQMIEGAIEEFNLDAIPDKEPKQRKPRVGVNDIRLRVAEKLLDLIARILG